MVGTNGRYGSPGQFPTSSYQSSNYFRDVVFSPGTTYTISGTIAPAAGGAGATVTLSGAASRSVIADANGLYSFSGLAPGSYTVTPTKAGYSFTPTSAPVSLTTADVTGLNFTATRRPPTPSPAAVAPAASGAGATVTSPGPPPAAVIADATGALQLQRPGPGQLHRHPHQGGLQLQPRRAPRSASPPPTSPASTSPPRAAADTTPPQVTAFTLPATAGSLTVPVTSFSASDATGVTGYLLTESAAPRPRRRPAGRPPPDQLHLHLGRQQDPLRLGQGRRRQRLHQPERLGHHHPARGGSGAGRLVRGRSPCAQERRGHSGERVGHPGQHGR